MDLIIARAGVCQECRTFVNRALQGGLKKLTNLSPVFGIHFLD
jgi:hypothetical protein